MRIHIIAVGRAKRGPEKDLFDAYLGRMRWPVKLHEVEEKKPLSGPELKAREADLLLGAVPDGAVVVFSAHGISQKVEDSAKLRDLPYLDATCPLVT